MKIIIGLVFLGILISLGGAGFFMLRKKNNEQTKQNGMVRALSIRIALSVALFLLLIILWALGFIEPTGIIPGQA